MWLYHFLHMIVEAASTFRSVSSYFWNTFEVFMGPGEFCNALDPEAMINCVKMLCFRYATIQSWSGHNGSSPWKAFQQILAGRPHKHRHSKKLPEQDCQHIAWYISWIISTGWWTWIIESMLVTLQFGFCRHWRIFRHSRHFHPFSIAKVWTLLDVLWSPPLAPFGRSNGMLLTHRCLLEANSQCFWWKLKWWVVMSHDAVVAIKVKLKAPEPVSTRGYAPFPMVAGLEGWCLSLGFVVAIEVEVRNESIVFVRDTMRRISCHCNQELSQNCKELTKEL